MNYIIGTFITILLAVLVTPGLRALYIEKTKPLEIKPRIKKIVLSKNGNSWNEEFFVYLINRSSSPYFDINIISEFPEELNVSVLPEKSDVVSLGTKENGISMGVDFMLGLENKERYIGVTQTVMNNIGPNETKKIKVLVRKNDYKASFDMKFKLGNFSKLPKPIMSKV